MSPRAGVEPVVRPVRTTGQFARVWRYPDLVPTYEFLCRDCGTHFDVQRPMSASSDPASCPDGHADTIKLLSILAVAGRSGGGSAGGAGAPSGGGCCGGACGCG